MGKPSRIPRNKVAPRDNPKTVKHHNSNTEMQKSGDPFFIKATNKSRDTFRNKKNQSDDTKNRGNVKRRLDKNSDHRKVTDESKKPFDKKKWRLKKYSNKYKLEQWENSRKKEVLRGYYKDIQGDEGKNNFDVQKIYEQYPDSDDDEEQEMTSGKADNKEKGKKIERENPINKIQGGTAENSVVEEKIVRLNRMNKTQGDRPTKPFRRAHEEFVRLKQEKVDKKEEAAKRRAEKEEKLKIYKEKKAEKFKKLNKKNKKGQPIMKDRLEMLLEKIQSTMT